MSKLKELTWHNHQKAERTKFARKLLGGISPKDYYRYLYNQYMLYHALETRAADLLPELRGIFRSQHIIKDLQELERLYDIENSINNLMPVVSKYEQHLEKLDRDGILAHIYVRHFGDMYGGQMIKKHVPGSGLMYNFIDVDNLKQTVRAMLHDSMADEANSCFEFAMQLFEELERE